MQVGTCALAVALAVEHCPVPFGTYVAEAPALWTAALLVAGVAALDQSRPVVSVEVV